MIGIIISCSIMIMRTDMFNMCITYVCNSYVNGYYSYLNTISPISGYNNILVYAQTTTMLIKVGCAPGPAAIL